MDETAASSPATIDATAPPAGDVLKDLSREQRQHWQSTGELPTSAPTAAAASPAEADPVPAVSADSAPAPAESPAPTPKPKGKGVEARNVQLDAEIRDLQDKLKLRAQLREEVARLVTPPTPPAPARQDPTGPPNPDTFTYGTADPAYIDALADFKVEQKLRQRDTEQAERAKATQLQTERQKLVQSWQSKVEAARQKHEDFDAVALYTPSEIPPGSIADVWILEAEAGADVLYALQKDPTERSRILALNGIEQLTALVRLGDRLTGTTPTPSKPPVSAAPPPPPVLGTRPGPGPDEIEAALVGNDVRGYIAAQNKREFNARQGR